MSVPTWKRSESATEFMKELHELNVRCGQIVMKQPNKYRQNYGDELIKLCLQALECANEANDKYVSVSMSQDQFDERERLFSTASAKCKDIIIISRIFFELVKNIDGHKDDCTKNEIFFAEKCGRITSLIKGVMDSDKRRYQEYKSKS